MLWLEWRLWGNRPAGYHVVNVLLHAAGAVLLWRVLRRLAVPGAWLAGLLFAVHPVSVASAAWITELKSTLSLALYLLTLLVYLRYEDRAGLRWRLLAIGLCLLALLAKTSVVVLPLVMLLCAWWRRGTVRRQDVVRSLPFFILSLTLGLVTVWFHSHNAVHGLVVRPEGIASRVAAAGWIIWFYLYKIVLPLNLCGIYPRWNVPGAGVLTFLPLLLLLGCLAGFWACRKSCGRAPFFALSYFAIGLLPVLGFANMLFMGLSLVADHLQYLAMAAPIALIAAFFVQMADRGGWEKRAAGTAAVGCVAVLAVLTWQRASLYADEKRFWEDNLSRNPAPAVWNGLGMACFNSGLSDRAIHCLDAAVEAWPGYGLAWYNRGYICARLGRDDQAEHDYGKAIESDGDYAEAYNGRGNARARMGRLEEAARDYDRAIALLPTYAVAHFNRANVFTGSGAYGKALSDYGAAIALDPHFADAFYRRANLFVRLQRLDEALRDYDECLRLRPSFAQAWNNRGKLLADMGRVTEGISDYDQALMLRPDFAEACYNRGNALCAVRRIRDGIRDYDEAIRLQPLVRRCL